jgi:hypothetical protein
MPIQINNVPRRVVYAPTGTGGEGPYAFTFEILAAGDIAVYKDDTLLTLTTHYTVTIAENGTGSVTITAAGLALSPVSPAQYAIVGNRTIARLTDYVTGGDFFANTLNDELDQQTIFAQQNAEGLARALTAPITDPTTIDMTLPRKADRANKYLAFDADGNPQPGDTAVEVASIASIADEIVAVAAIDTEVQAVAAVDTEVTTVAGIAANVTTVAGIAANVTTVAAIDTDDLAAVAAIDTEVGTVAGIAANVTTVAGISAAVSTVATNIVDIQNAEENADAAEAAQTAAEAAQAAAESARDSTLAAFDSFDDRYLGTKTSDPTLDNDGNALVAGALYFNSVSGIMKVYTGSAWVAAYVSAEGLLEAANNLSDLASAPTALTNLGGTTVGKAVFTAANVGAAQQALDLEVGVDVQAYDATIVVDADIGVTVQAFDAGTSTASNTQTLTNKTINLVNNTVTVDGTDAVGFRNTPVNSQSAAYTLVLADSGKTIFHPVADDNARTFTIPANSSVAYPVGTVVSFVNLQNTVTIAITTDTMYLANDGATGSRTLAEYGMASAMKVDSTSWIISGNGLT